MSGWALRFSDSERDTQCLFLLLFRHVCYTGHTQPPCVLLNDDPNHQLFGTIEMDQPISSFWSGEVPRL